MVRSLLFLIFPLLLFASIEGIWKLDLSLTQKKNPNSRSYRAFSSMQLEFKNSKIYQDSSVIALYRIDNQKIYESQSGKNWELSALHVEADRLTLNIGSSLLYFKKINLDKELTYSTKIDEEPFEEEDFYKDNMHRYFDKNKILWKHSDLYNTFKNMQEVHYRIYQGISKSISQTDTHVFHFQNTTLTTFSYRKFGVRQNDWIHMDWSTYDHNKTYFADKDDEISFSPLFGNMELFHVVGKEDIVTPAGTFRCTKVKGIEEPWDNPTIIWMIDNKPGIYAKVINFKEKKLYLLENIKEK